MEKTPAILLTIALICGFSVCFVLLLRTYFDPWAPNPMEREVIDLVNKERAKHGLEGLKINRDLCHLARLKSEDMRDHKYYSHISPRYGGPFKMMTDFGVPYGSATELIVPGYSDAQGAMESWMKSKAGHREAILDKGYSDIGVGYAKGGPWGHYWTQMFIHP